VEWKAEWSQQKDQKDHPLPFLPFCPSLDYPKRVVAHPALSTLQQLSYPLEAPMPNQPE
jgi:hypothetical protein